MQMKFSVMQESCAAQDALVLSGESATTLVPIASLENRNVAKLVPAMPDNTQVKDTSSNPSVNIFSLFFLRQGGNKAIPLQKWLRMLIVEAIFGEELLENLVITTAAGVKETLNRLVPRGILIDRVRGLLVEVLFFKHAVQYKMIDHTNPGSIIYGPDPLDLTNAKFALRNGVAYEIIYFRRVYHLIFFCLNIAVSLLVHFFSESTLAAVTAFVLLQLGKRAKM